MNPHDKIGLIKGITLLTTLGIILIIWIRLTIKELKQAKKEDDDSFNKFMNKKS
jgi:hypothetical protein